MLPASRGYKMKGKLLTIGFSTVLVSILMCTLVYASWSTLGTGYAVTSNINGTPVAGNPVTIIAGTLDSTVKVVTFRWLAPPNGSGDCLLDETVPVYTNGTIGQWNNGTQAEIRYAQSTFKVYQGEWIVQVIFHSFEGEAIAEKSFRIDVIDSDLVATDTGTIFYTPELPLGTIGATVAMGAALGLFMIKKKRQQK
jgi:hypothetical protein